VIRVLAAFVLVLSLGDAQEGGADRSAGGTPPEKEKQGERGTTFVRRLEAVTWNPVRAELSWTVSVWNLQGGERSLVAKERYTVHPDDAIMESDGEFRRFNSTEAKRLRVLMDVISTYAVGSTVWWDDGPDAKLDGQIIPLPDDDQGGEATKNKKQDGKSDKDQDGKPDKDKDQKAKPDPKIVPHVVGPKAEPDAPLAESSAIRPPRY
jgi:hypothetical protein